MKNLVNTYVDQFRQDRQKQLKLAAVLAALALIVAGVVFWQLHSTGVAMTNEVFCGQEEHVHDDGCYEQVLICDNEEADHVHDDSCFETVLTCQIPEHTHTIECMTDDTADVETANMWEATLPALSGNWSQDVAAIAESQIGYTESTANFVLADDGETHMGYTRYGAWYGNEYGDWDAMFASFCLNYANIPASVVAENSGAYALAVSLNEQGLYIDSADFTPAAGDLVFFDEDGNGQADRVGIIVNVGDNKLAVIEGNSEDAVAENTYDINDSGILAFGILPDQGTPEGVETDDGVLYMANDGGVYVSVTAPADTLPEGAELSVTLVDEDSTDYAEAAEVIGLNLQTLSSDEEESGMAVLDICFLLDGKEVEPVEPVTVSINAGAILPEGAGNIVIQHLEETNEGVVPVLMAELNSSNSVAEFEVESFSSFTVTWSMTTGGAAGTSYSLTVTAYLDGTELNDIGDLTFSSENDELDFVTLLSDVDYGTGDYTFSYAIATVGNQTYGSQDNPIVAIEIETTPGGGPAGSTSNFVLVYSDGSTDTVATSSTVSVYAYYLTPDFSVSIEAADEDESTEAWALQAVLAHTGSYESISYEWTVTDKDGSTSQYAKVTNTDNTGRAYIAWEDGTPDNTEVTVSVTVTLTLEDGETKTATADYVLEYGDETVDLIMTYGPNKTALPEGVTVTLTSESGVTYTGTTDSDGWVHDLDIEPGIYTVTATYTDSTGTYQCSETIAFHDAGNYSVNLNYYDEEILISVPNRSNWEHIDIKLSVGTSSNSDSGSVRVDIVGAQIISSNGTVKYTATEDSIEGNDNEFQLTFYEGEDTTGTPSHAIEFDTTDTITITYVLTVDGVPQDPVTITITASTVYDEGTTYPVDGERAYKLYNYLYGTSYSSNAQMIADGIDDIDISGMSMMLVAAILCDSSEVTGPGQVQASSDQSANQWGMDFALSIEAMNELAASWAFNIEKTYENASMTAGDFVFYLYNATVEDGIWSLGDLQSTLTNQTAGMDWDGNSHDTMELFSIAYSDEAIQNGETYYYILYEQPDTVTSRSEATITFDGTIFGVMVQLGTDADGEATVTATYYRMEQDGNTYTIAETYTTGTSVDGKITFDEDDYATFEFTNSYQNYTEISVEKVWVDNDNAANMRPNSVTVDLLVNGEQAYDDEGQPITGTLSEENNWVYVFEDLPMYDGVTELTYSITEVLVVDNNYATTVTKNDEGEYTYTITNTYTEKSFPVDIFKYTTEDDEEYLGLEGAEFRLTISDAESGETYTVYFDQNSDGSYKYGGVMNDPDSEYGEFTFVLTSGDDGYIHIENLPSGTYTLTETSAPAGYAELNQNIVFVLDEDGNIEITSGATSMDDDAIGIANEWVGFPVEVYKYDSATNKSLEGASFVLGQTIDDQNEQYGVFTYDGETYTFSEWRLNNFGGNSNCYMYTDEDGYIHIDGLEPGDYWLLETEPLDGYLPTEEHFEFTINEDGTVVSDYLTNAGVIAIPNNEAGFDVLKTDENGLPLEGAEFIMGVVGQYAQMFNIPVDGTNYYYDYLMFTNDGTSIYEYDNVTDDKDEATTLASGEDGYFSVRGLKTESLYFLIETKAPDGYDMLDNPIAFYVDYDGTITIYSADEGRVSVDESTIVVMDETEVFDVLIYKYAAWPQIFSSNDLELYDVPDGNPLAGAEFILSITDETTGTVWYAQAEGETDAVYGNFVYTITGWTDNVEDATTFVTYDDGYINILNLVADTYTLTETRAPYGYELLTESIVFTINSEDGSVIIESGPAEVDDGVICIENEEAPTFDVMIYKYADNGEDESEPEPPQVMRNYNIKNYSVSYDSPLAGAEFILSTTDDTGTVLYVVADYIDDVDYPYYIITGWTENVEEATTVVSYTDGYVEFGNLAAGEYTLTETKAPDGYWLLEESIVFTVDEEDGTVTVVSGPADTDGNDNLTWITIANEEIQPGSFELLKTDDDGNILSGAEFILGYFWEYEGSSQNYYLVSPDGEYEYWYGILDYDADRGIYVFNWYDSSETREGATTLVTDENGIIRIEDLPYSDEYDAGFFLIETKAPDGYKLLEDPIVFTVNSDGTISIAVDNDSVSVDDDGLIMTVENIAYRELPNAGGIGTWIYTAAGLVLIGGAASLLVYRKRRAV